MKTNKKTHVGIDTSKKCNTTNILGGRRHAMRDRQRRISKEKVPIQYAYRRDELRASHAMQMGQRQKGSSFERTLRTVNHYPVEFL